MMLRLLGIPVVLCAVWLFRPRGLGESKRLSERSVATMDWLRGLAAVSVLIGHVRGLFMQDLEALRKPTLLWKLYYLVSGLGHQAVIVFFILSGFLVGSTVLARTAERRWNMRDYLLRRLTRLYVVLIPGLLLTAAWDSAGMHLFGTAGLYGGVLNAPHLIMPDVRVTLSWGHLLGNLAFLQHLFISPFGSNGPLWSLPYEFWAYLLFPLVVRASDESLSHRRRLSYLLVSGGLVVAGGWKLALYFAIWLFGAVLALWWRARERAPASLIMRGLLWGMFFGGVVLGRTSRLPDAVADLVLGLVTAALLAGILSSEPTGASPPARSLEQRAAARLAGFSYTLYVAHYPVLTFWFAATMDSSARLAASADAVARVLGMSLCLLGYAFVVSQLSEAHTDRIRQLLVRRFRAG